MQIPAIPSYALAQLGRMQLDHLTPLHSRPCTLPYYTTHNSISNSVILPTVSSLPQVSCTSTTVTWRPCHRHSQHIITLTSCLRLQCSSRVGTSVSSSILVVSAREFDFTSFSLIRVTYISWATLPFCFAFFHKTKSRKTPKKLKNTHCLCVRRASGWPPVSSKLTLLTDGQNNHQKRGQPTTIY